MSDERRTRRRDEDDTPTVPPRSRDDSDVGWGERPDDLGDERDDEWYRRERPPHHDRD